MVTIDAVQEVKKPIYHEQFVLMGTIVQIWIVGRGSPARKRESIARAVQVMYQVEHVCSRFDEGSELSQLCRHPGEKTSVSPTLFYALRIALATSELTKGVFDPTVGRALERQGFDRHYATGERVSTPAADVQGISYRDIQLFEETASVRLAGPMALDLGAVAKGLAVDLACRELQSWEGYAIDAGGDCYVYGIDPRGLPWTVVIEDPTHGDYLAMPKVALSGQAVCSSGNYRHRRRGANHLYDAVKGQSAEGFLTMTVVAPLTVLADVSATAAFLLGPGRAHEFLQGQHLAAYGRTQDGRTVMTDAMKEFLR